MGDDIKQIIPKYPRAQKQRRTQETNALNINTGDAH